ncbi:MAG: glycoside hydrolase family 127 protein [Clostridia bacterium]|nr:glycoside hydrolase family 127 protein [Clostridia bacterium]
MKNFNKCIRLPLGAVKAEGFLKDQLLRCKDGMTGHLKDLEPEMIALPYIKKTYVKAWGPGDQSGWGAEISGNYWTGYIQSAFVLDDEEMKKEATEWVDGMMKNQKADGYLGTFYEDDANIYDDFNGWDTACAMRGLIALYEATGRKDVLEAVHRCMLWFTRKWSGDNKTFYAAPYLIDPMILTYLHTGDETLAEYAKEYLEMTCERDIFESSYKALLSDEFHYNSNHTAAVGYYLRLPAMVYTAFGNEEYLKASEKGIRKVRKYSTQLSGGPVSISEYLGPVGGTKETEYCSYAYFNATFTMMGIITGKAIYGDYMEEMYYNGAMGARKKDEKAIAYLSAPNQFMATTTSSTAGAKVDMQAYTPCYPVSCCPVNAVCNVPEFIRDFMMSDNDGNLYVQSYGPCRLDYNGIKINVNTLYPFRNKVSLEINCDKAFTLFLKNPMWAKGFEVTVNGEKADCSADENGYIKLERTWKCTDVVEISFKAEVEVIKVDDTDGPAVHPIAVKYGALLYSYHIPEDWIPTEGSPMTPLPEGWSWFELVPFYRDPPCKSHHEATGLRRNYINWNLALDENIAPSDFTIEEIEPCGYVWENTPIKLHAHCYKAPYIMPPYPNRTLEPCGEYQVVTHKLPLTLEPFGCTNLRLTYFPKAALIDKNKQSP